MVGVTADAATSGTAAARGQFRVYLGAAPGVGKTVAMLDEGQRRAERGADVVIGVVETHGRPRTAERATGLESIPLRTSIDDGQVRSDLDLDAVLARRPEVVLIDALEHTNGPGARHSRRWHEVEELLAAGIGVITTLNVQHLESLRDVVARITGVEQRDTVPDAFVRRADQIELVDMSPEALRRRMSHGNVYPPERIDAALSNYFRAGNLGALRELSLLWLADGVESGLDDYRARNGITTPWETRERIVVALTAAPGGEGLIRRASRLASRARGELIGVHVRSGDGVGRGDETALDHHRELLLELGGTYHEITGDDIARALVTFAAARQATQLVLGSSGKSTWSRVASGSIIARTIREADDVDVHVIARDTDGSRLAVRSTPTWFSGHLPRRRVLLGWAILAFGLPLLTLFSTHERTRLGLAANLLLSLGLVVVAAVAGGVVPGIIGAVAATLVANYYLIEPLHTLKIYNGEQAVALVVFVAVAATVSGYVTLAARRTNEARRARREAVALARATATIVGEPDPVPAVLEQLRADVAATGIAVFRLDGGRAERVAGVGDAAGDPSEGHRVALGGDPEVVLVITGARLTPDDELRLYRRADQVTLALVGRERQLEGARLAALEQIDVLRTAMLHAVSHDLRTPLTSIKAAVTSLLSDDVHWSAEQSNEFLHTVDEQADRLTRLVENLLDMSRLEAGVLTLHVEPVAIDDVIATVLGGLQPSEAPVEVGLADDLPLVLADPALLERALANVVSNALRYSPTGRPVRLNGDVVDDRFVLHVVDHGPGIATAQRELVLRPFQRLGDQVAPNGAGVGLGLAVADGFATAMGGQLVLLDTPGGGLTVQIVLAVASAAPTLEPLDPERTTA